jgi:hypothetical protein
MDASLLSDLVTGLTGLLHEAKFWFVFVVALIGGVLRGFSGFGGALVVIPLSAMALGPQMAVPMFYLFDLGSATPYGYAALPRCNFREILPMLAGHLLMLPLGTYLLTSLDPLVLRWIMEVGVLAMLALLLSGWRYTGKPTAPLSFAVGIVGGIMGVTAGMAGPPIIAYWLGRKENATVIRTNIMAYYALSSSATDIALFLRGLFTWEVMLHAILIWPAYAIGLWGGAKLFHRSGEKFFRIAAYCLVAMAAIFSAPIFDGLFR